MVQYVDHLKILLVYLKILSENIISIVKRFKIISVHIEKDKKFILRFNLIAAIYNIDSQNHSFLGSYNED